MANDDWKYKELPKAAGETAPSVWNPKENKWEVYTGSTNVVELENKLETIEEQQKQILERLDGTFNTQVTGSNAELINITKNDVEAGAVIRVLDYDFDIKEYSKFYITARTLGESWDVMVRFQPSETDIHITRTYKEDIEREF